MNENDRTVGRVLTHPGTQYGGTAQPVIRNNRSSSGTKTKRKKHWESRPQRPLTLAEEKMEWVLHPEVSRASRPVRVVNCLTLVYVIKRLLARSPSRYDPLYRELRDVLNDVLEKAFKEGQLEKVMRFEMTARGISSSRKGKPTTRVKVEIPELKREFELPYTFLHTCREAFR